MCVFQSGPITGFLLIHLRACIIYRSVFHIVAENALGHETVEMVSPRWQLLMYYGNRKIPSAFY